MLSNPPPEHCLRWLALTGIRVATAWYNSHISLTHPPIRGQPNKILPSVVLMTEDADNRRKAEQENIPSVSGPYPLPVLVIHPIHPSTSISSSEISRGDEGLPPASGSTICNQL